MTDYIAHTPDENKLITYCDEENAIWRDLIARQQANLPNRACDEYLTGLAKLDLPTDRIPQLPEVDAVLMRETGWQTAPVPALISFGKFFKLLAECKFPVAT